MDENIAVGILVGLSIGITAYIWNSDWFTKSQKYILLILILFPPLQWGTAIILFVFNSQRFKNTKEYKEESKINSSTASLKELRDKGILTDDEYKTKIQKLETEKTEQDLRNSIEYKQLKNLLDSGILTNEEFDNKLNLLSSISDKETDIKKVNGIVNSVNETYLGEIKETKKGNSIPIYIFSILFFTLLIGGAIFLTDRNSNNTNVNSNYSEPAVVDTISTYQNNYQETIKNKKFVYVVMKIEKPNLDVYEPKGFINSVGFYETLDPIYSINYEKETYSTDIIEISNYNIDEKYKVLDDAKDKMYSQLKFVDDAFSTNLWVKCKDGNKREEFKGIRSKITNSQIFEFDSYSEASIYKQNNLE